MTKVKDKPRFINRGYGKEMICTNCTEYYPLNSNFFYARPPSSQRGLTIVYEGLCIPCYNERKRKYRLKALERKKNESLHTH